MKRIGCPERNLEQLAMKRFSPPRGLTAARVELG